MEEEVEKIINNLLPPELEKVKNVVDNLLNVDQNSKNGNLKYLTREKKITCPNNANHRIKKNGHKNRTQRYWCHDCKISFSLTDKTIIKYSKINYYQIKKLLSCMYDYKPLYEIALEIGLSKTSTFELQMRIFEAIENIYGDIKLKEEIQADEIYVRISFKGFKNGAMPRPPRYNGNSNLTSGISKDQMCIIVAIDSYDNIIIKVVGNGPASNDMISKALYSHIESGSLLITDSKNSYQKFADDNNLKLIQIPADKHMIDGHTINDVNEIMTEISNYLNQKHGVSSRHLQQHMNYIRYRKIIKYLYEYLDINENMYRDIIKIPININSDDVYSTDIPFNIDEYKDWWDSHY